MKDWKDEIAPMNAPAHPDGFGHIHCPFLWLCRNQDDKIDLQSFLCQHCSKWFAMSGGTGNVWKHVKKRHSSFRSPSDSAHHADRMLNAELHQNSFS
jgi:hypothetical protein